MHEAVYRPMHEGVYGRFHRSPDALGRLPLHEAVYICGSNPMHEVVYAYFSKPMHEVVYDFFGVPAAGRNRSYRGEKGIKQGAETGPETAIKTAGKWPVLACVASYCVGYMILYPYAVHACKAL